MYNRMDREALLKIKQREEMLKNRPIREIIGILNRSGIDLTEERIVSDYQKTKDVEELSSAYYRLYEDQLKRLDAKNLFVNSDALPRLILRIIPLHMNPADIGDPGFVDEWLLEISSRQPVRVSEAELGNILISLIHYAERTGVHKLNEIGHVFSYNKALVSLFSGLSHPSDSMVQLLGLFQETFPDADPAICPAVMKGQRTS